MPRFDWIQVGNGPVTLTCCSCNERFTAEPQHTQKAADQHKCGRNTKNAGR